MFNLHFGIERWKYNKEYNVYVSNYGNIKDENKQIIYPKGLNGYLFIVHNKKVIRVHRLVLETFKPQTQEGLTVDHIDHNIRNNRLSNLRWLSVTDNISDGNEGIDQIKDVGVFEYLQGIREEPTFSKQRKSNLMKKVKERKSKNYLFELCYCMKRENKVVVDIDTAAYIIFIKNGSPIKQVKDFLENLAINESEKTYKFGFDIDLIKES